MAKIHIDPKSLKQDPFRDFGFQLIDHAYRQRRRYIALGVALVALVGGVVGYRAYTGHVLRTQAAAFHDLEQRIGELNGPLADTAPKARAAVEGFIARFPAGRLTPVAWMYMARLAFAEKDWDKAEFAFKQALASAGGDATMVVQAKVGLAKTLEARGKLDESVALYQELPEERYGDLKALELGRLALQRNDRAAARMQFQAVVNHEPPSILSAWAQEELDFTPEPAAAK
ncbi:MAG: tetratricopeptide repeat protein [Candidatus Lambdaproteobacteria bacterium]|nr:tetratricopeptide repeat protein [Candidatus Lambdaproteobacteria bacterium]